MIPTRRRCFAAASRLPRVCACLLIAGLGGCATYKPLSLGHPRAAASVAHLSVPAASMPTPVLAGYPFNPVDGLDATEVAMLAVADNPQLKVRRDDLGVAKAQAFAAGLLPDPQLNLGVDFPGSRASGLTTGYTLGLSEDLGALLLRSGRKQVAECQVRQVNLDLLWAEWQTVAQARLLFDKVRTLRARKARLDSEQTALTPLANHIQKALQAGNMTYATANSGLDAMASVRQQSATTTTSLHKASAQLRLLLGLTAEAPLDLTGAFYLPQPNRSQLKTALASLPRRRPDLLALQAGYQAQNGRLRQAILAQFPAITLGFNRARDTGNVTSNGFTLGITLPLFNRNRGQIAIARASRQKLKDAYTARLLATRSDMHRLQADLATLQKLSTAASAHAKKLDASLMAASDAWQRRLLDWPTYLAIRSAALAADLQSLDVREQMAEQAIALTTLLGNTHFNPAQVTTP
ncbi:MAG TPA: TolC family protein [Oleiagrimonas sp.]|nr:TolC family protein [Oleiagrimonas sp.]